MAKIQRKNIVENKKSEKFFLERDLASKYNRSSPFPNSQISMEKEVEVMMQSDVITGKEVRSEEKVNTYFLKWTNVSEREKAKQEEKREALLDFLTILVKKYGYKVLKK